MAETLIPPSCAAWSRGHPQTAVATVAVSAVSTVCLALGLWAWVLSPLFAEPPTRILTSDVVGKSVPQGGELLFHIESRTTPKQCEGGITREFWQCVKPEGCQISDDDAWVKRRESAVQPPITLPGASDRYFVAVPLPELAPPGDYMFVGRTHYTCPWWAGRAAPGLTGPMPFKIVPRDRQ